MLKFRLEGFIHGDKIEIREFRQTTEGSAGVLLLEHLKDMLVYCDNVSVSDKVEHIK